MPDEASKRDMAAAASLRAPAASRGAWQRIMLTTFFIGAAAWFTYNSFDQTATGRYMPLIVGIPTLVLALLALRTDIGLLLQPQEAFRTAVSVEESAMSSGESDDGSGKGLAEWQVFATLGVLFLTFYLFGLIGTAFAFVAGYMRIVGRDRFATAIVVGISTAMFMQLFFVELLNLQVYRGYASRVLLPTLMGG